MQLCLRSFLFCAVTQRWLEVSYRRLGRVYRSHLQGSKWADWPLMKGPRDCPETSVIKYQGMPRNTHEEGRPHLHCGGSLKLSKIFVLLRRSESQTSQKKVVKVLTGSFRTALQCISVGQWKVHLQKNQPELWMIKVFTEFLRQYISKVYGLES